MRAEPDAPLHVVATAGHVDHGKSSLILRLTGMDPDRLVEEKRRGLTIDLGFAWTMLPSGREIGFVDVPGHERFIRNMLAGVGPVRLVLFVVAADEGWKPQSEEHLQIVDVLHPQGAVVALTKADLVDGEQLRARMRQVRERLEGTRLAGAPVVACSATTGGGIGDLRGALDAMVGAAPPGGTSSRPRQFVDRVFTIKGAGTVVTGTLTGGPLAVGQEVEILPSGHRARIRGLQTHKRALQTARPVSRVAVNLAGTSKAELERGDALVLPGQWRATSAFDAVVRPVRALNHGLSSRGAYKLYVGSAERDVRVRFLTDRGELGPGVGTAFARIRTTRPVVLDMHDPFILREAGRRETVAGGLVLDVGPPARWDGRHTRALMSRHEAEDAPSYAMELVHERGFVRASDVLPSTGALPRQAEERGAIRLGSWLAWRSALEEVGSSLIEGLRAFHAEHPLGAGLEVSEARAVLGSADPAFTDQGLAEALISFLESSGQVVRSGATIRLPQHRASTAGREDADRLVSAVVAGEPSPPTVKELVGAGFGTELIRAACSDGRLVRISTELVISPAYLARAEATARRLAGTGELSVSRFREELNTSRKYGLPILEYFDAHGLTRRQGDLRVLRG